MPSPRPSGNRRPPLQKLQRGWAGLIALLIALLVVAWLSRTVLFKLLPQPETTMIGKGQRAGNRVPGAAAPADLDPTTATPVPRNELERARGLESTIRDQAADMSKRIDDSMKQ